MTLRLVHTNAFGFFTRFSKWVNMLDCNCWKIQNDCQRKLPTICSTIISSSRQHLQFFLMVCWIDTLKGDKQHPIWESHVSCVLFSPSPSSSSVLHLIIPHRLLQQNQRQLESVAVVKGPLSKCYKYILPHLREKKLVPIMRPSQFATSIDWKNQWRRETEKECSAIETKWNLIRKLIFVVSIFLNHLFIVSCATNL